jgi:upstream-binding transcription factor
MPVVVEYDYAKARANMIKNSIYNKPPPEQPEDPLKGLYPVYEHELTEGDFYEPCYVLISFGTILEQVRGRFLVIKWQDRMNAVRVLWDREKLWNHEKQCLYNGNWGLNVGDGRVYYNWDNINRAYCTGYDCFRVHKRTRSRRKWGRWIDRVVEFNCDRPWAKMRRAEEYLKSNPCLKLDGTKPTIEEIVEMVDNETLDNLTKPDPKRPIVPIEVQTDAKVDGKYLGMFSHLERLTARGITEGVYNREYIDCSLNRKWQRPLDPRKFYDATYELWKEKKRLEDLKRKSKKSVRVEPETVVKIKSKQIEKPQPQPEPVVKKKKSVRVEPETVVKIKSKQIEKPQQQPETIVKKKKPARTEPELVQIKPKPVEKKIDSEVRIKTKQVKNISIKKMEPEKDMTEGDNSDQTWFSSTEHRFAAHISDYVKNFLTLSGYKDAIPKWEKSDEQTALLGYIKVFGKRAFNQIKNRTIDPNRPKRPPTAYILYKRAKREKYKEKNPRMTPREINTLLTEKWNNLSDKRRAKYEELAKPGKDMYEVIKTNYKKPAPTEIEKIVQERERDIELKRKRLIVPKNNITYIWED